jgi:hypothetical protein
MKEEVLQTKAPEHTDLKGWVELILDTETDSTIDNFRVLEKIKSDEDVEGNCYDWYRIDQHYRVVDHWKRVHDLNERTDIIENAMCENDEDLESRLAEIENALCELDERG